LTAAVRSSVCLELNENSTDVKFFKLNLQFLVVLLSSPLEQW